MAPPRKNPVDEEGLKLLRAVGRAIHGDRWYAGLARALDAITKGEGTIDASVVRRWDLGERSMPSWAVPRLEQVIEAEQDQIFLVRKAIDLKEAALNGLLNQVLSHGAPDEYAPPVVKTAKTKPAPAPPVDEPEPDEDDAPAPSM